MSETPSTLTERHFASVEGEWVCMHPKDAPLNHYISVSVYQGKHEMDRITVRDAANRTGIPYDYLKKVFTSPAPKPGDYKPKKADKVEADKPKAEKPAAKKAAAKADK